MFPKSLSSINKSMKTILQQLSLKALGTCWWQWDLFYFPAIDFSPFMLPEIPLSTEKWTDSAPFITKYFITRKDSWGLGSQDLPFPHFSRCGAPGTDPSCAWGQQRCDSDREQNSRWTSVLPARVSPQLLPTPPNQELGSQHKTPTFPALPKLCSHPNGWPDMGWAKLYETFCWMCNERNHLPIHQLQQWNNVPGVRDPTLIHYWPFQNHPGHFLLQNQLGFISRSSCCSIFLTGHAKHEYTSIFHIYFNNSPVCWFSTSGMLYFNSLLKEIQGNLERVTIFTKLNSIIHLK